MGTFDVNNATATPADFKAKVFWGHGSYEDGTVEADGTAPDWVKNLRKTPAVTVRIAARTFEGRARVVGRGREDELARRLLVEKYESTPGSLSNWRRSALPVAVDLRG